MLLCVCVFGLCCESSVLKEVEATNDERVVSILSRKVQQNLTSSNLLNNLNTKHKRNKQTQKYF